MGEWSQTTLGEVVQLQRGHDLPTQDRRPGPVPIVGSFGITGWHDTAKAKGPGVTIGRSGASFGTAAYVDGDYWPLNTCLYVTDFRGNDPRWVFSLLHEIDFSGYNSGSAQPSLNRNFLAKIPVQKPPVDEQRRIAGVLGALDDLIEANRVQAERLDELVAVAAAQFMSSVAGRGTVPLSRFCSTTKGFSYKSAELAEGADTLVNLKNIGRGGTFERRGFKPLSSDRYKESQVVLPGDIVVSMTDLTQNRDVVARPVRVPEVQVAGRLVASLDLSIVRPESGYSREFLAAALRQEEFHSFALGYCNGTTVVHLSSRVFDDYQLPDIAPEEAAELSSMIAALNAQADACNAEIDELTRVRDELLPLLMSGRVRVREVA
jgi:type I restriction enzyme S subunit